MPQKLIIIIIALSFYFFSCEKEDTETSQLNLVQVNIGSVELDLSANTNNDIQVDRPITLIFSSPLDKSSAESHILLKQNEDIIETDLSFSSQDKTVTIYPSGPLNNSTSYTIFISDQLKGARGESFTKQEIVFRTIAGELQITAIEIGGFNASNGGNILNVPVDISVMVSFSVPVNQESLKNATQITGSGNSSLTYSFSNENREVEITSSNPLNYITKYTFTINNSLQGDDGEPFSGYSKIFYTQFDETPKFPVISDEQLLDLVQEQTFKYFWDFAHPESGMARERNTSGDLVTTGGSGFGVMAILVGIERGFITRQQGIDRLAKIVDFLGNADRFHGVWPHWLNGNTGDVIPFSERDDGGDLVETAFMIQGLLTVRQYLNTNDPTEENLYQAISQLWESVEWDWYTQNENVLYWHWSPNYNWQMNHKIQGWNESLITYILAAASKTHGISADVYHQGWARNGNMANGNDYFGITLPLGEERGGPLFFAHYSFLGLDPRTLEDQYANYWTQNVNHTLINRAYCVANPKNFVGYGENCWGLTASDNHLGYSAHSPNNDLGVITPTAALSSFPYTPEESMEALKFFYYTLGDKLWGEDGFYDAFNPTEGWYADSYLAIDQGPIILMIENHRSNLLWDLFMSDPDVTEGLQKLGFIF